MSDSRRVLGLVFFLLGLLTGVLMVLGIDIGTLAARALPQGRAVAAIPGAACIGPALCMIFLVMGLMMMLTADEKKRYQDERDYYRNR